MSVWDVLRQSSKPIVLYGMGNGADKILDVLAVRGIAVSGVFASDDFCRGQQFRGFTVQRYDVLKQQFADMIVLVAFGTHRRDVMQNIKRIAAEQELYVPDVPLMGTELFDDGYFARHESDFEWVRQRLADAQSRRVLDNVLQYKRSGNPQLLWECETTIAEAYALLDLREGGIAVDAGAYNGDTVAEYLHFAGRPQRMFAIEPDAKNYKKLRANMKEKAFVQCVHAAVCDRDGTIGFDTAAGRQSAVQEQSERQITSVSMDGLLQGAAVDYMKFDVEGMELAALRGAAQTIRLYRPRMMVSAYHRNEDLFELPRFVLSLREDYKLYLRHFPALPAWDVNYYFV